VHTKIWKISSKFDREQQKKSRFKDLFELNLKVFCDSDLEIDYVDPDPDPHNLKKPSYVTWTLSMLETSAV